MSTKPRLLDAEKYCRAISSLLTQNADPTLATITKLVNSSAYGWQNGNAKSRKNPVLDIILDALSEKPGFESEVSTKLQALESRISNKSRLKILESLNWLLSQFRFRVLKRYAENNKAALRIEVIREGYRIYYSFDALVEITDILNGTVHSPVLLRIAYPTRKFFAPGTGVERVFMGSLATSLQLLDNSLPLKPYSADISRQYKDSLPGECCCACVSMRGSNAILIHPDSPRIVECAAQISDTLDAFDQLFIKHFPTQGKLELASKKERINLAPRDSLRRAKTSSAKPIQRDINYGTGNLVSAFQPSKEKPASSIDKEPAHPHVFICIPYGPEFLGVLRSAIEPAIRACGLSPIVASRKGTAVDHLAKVTKYIDNAKIVTADVTGGNPNVMLEVGIALHSSKPLIQIIQDTSKLPILVRNLGTIEYSNSDNGLDELKNQLVKRLKDALASADSTKAASKYKPTENPPTLPLPS